MPRFLRIGAFLKEARLNANLSQNEVKKILKYKSPQIISDWERGICCAPHRVLPILVKTYGIDVEEFVDIYLDAYARELEGWFSRKK